MTWRLASFQARAGRACRCSRVATCHVLVGVFLAAAARAGVTPLIGRGEGADVVAVREDWLAFEPLTLEELLQHVPGVVLSRRGGLGSRLYLQIAGSPTGRVRLAVDGIVYDEPELAWARLFEVPVSAIERIEVHRYSDPARLEVWTRQAQARAPITEIDLGRGELKTRTRRVQLQTPRRSWWVSGRYDEVLRGTHDFRTDRVDAVSELFGSFNGRYRSFDVGFERPHDESLRFRFEEFVDNTHGSAQSEEDFNSARRVLNSLRWSRSIGGSRWTLDASHMAWSRSRTASGVPAAVDESRGTLALDVDVPYGDGHRHSLRLRANDHEALQDDELHTQYQRYDLELQTVRQAAGVWNAWVGYHRHEIAGGSWSARVHARWRGATWGWEAQLGRGVSFAGWAEAAGENGERPGVFASLALSRSRHNSTLRVAPFAKDLEHQTAAAALYFPSLGRGPRRIAGAIADADWRAATGNWLTELAARLAWVPWVDGDRGGHPQLQAELRGRWSRLDLFDGDLVVTLQTLWRLETRREFTSTTQLPSLATGDVRLHLRVMQRMLLFWNIVNVADIHYETHPGVRMPDRRSLYGVRVQLIN